MAVGRHHRPAGWHRGRNHRRQNLHHGVGASDPGSVVSVPPGAAGDASGASPSPSWPAVSCVSCISRCAARVCHMPAAAASSSFRLARSATNATRASASGLSVSCRTPVVPCRPAVGDCRSTVAPPVWGRNTRHSIPTFSPSRVPRCRRPRTASGVTPSLSAAAATVTDCRSWLPPSCRSAVGVLSPIMSFIIAHRTAEDALCVSRTRGILPA